MTKKALDTGTIDKNIGEESTEVLSIDNKPKEVQDSQINSQEESAPELELKSKPESKQQPKQESELSRLFVIYKDAYSTMIEATGELRKYLGNNENKTSYEDTIAYSQFLIQDILNKQIQLKQNEMYKSYSKFHTHKDEELILLDGLFGVGQVFNKVLRDEL